MSNRGYKKTRILPGNLLPAGIIGTSTNLFASLSHSLSLNKKVILKFAFILSIIFTALSLLIVLLMRAVNGQAANLLSETTQSAQLQTGAPLISADEKDTVQPVSESTTDGQNSSKANVQVVINGENIPVPASGTVHREINNENGQSSVNISVQDGQVTTSTQTTNVSGGSYSSSYSSTQQYNNGVPQ